MNKNLARIIILVVFGGLLLPFCINELSNYFLKEQIVKQFEAEYQIIYVDPTYLILIGSCIAGFPLVLYALAGFRGNGEMGDFANKALAVPVLASVLFIFPGMQIEKQRLKMEAKARGFKQCPIFTIPKSPNSKNVIAMSKDTSLCRYPEIRKLSRTGSFNELQRIDSYLKSLER